MGYPLRHLQDLAAPLGDAVTVDDVARAALGAALGIPSVVRAGLAVSEGAGRQFRFVSTDQDALSPLGVRWCTIDGLADVPLAHSLRTGESVYLSDLDAMGRRYPQLMERQRGLGTRALTTLPLATRHTVLGGLLLYFDAETPFNEHEREFLQAFAAQASQALRRGLAYQVERGTSERLQRSLMPHSLPELPGLELGSYYQPGGTNVDVGGDWYDVMPLRDGSVLVSLGDVMGKGIPAAIVMGELRSALRAYALLDPDPSLLLPRLDEVVTTLSSDQIVTLAYAVLSPDRDVALLAVAGHPPPLFVPREGRPVFVDESVGPALGLGVSRGSWSTTKVSLSDGDTVLLYSDGLVEARDLELGEGLRQISSHVEAMGPRRRNPREMCARLGQLMWRPDTDDDVTAVAVTVPARRRPYRATTDLPGDSSAAGAARRFLLHHLNAGGVDAEQTATAQLCVSELVTNAVIHSGTSPSVALRVDDECILVLVSDGGGRGTVRHPEMADPDEISGRGLALVDALTTVWSAEHSADGTTVWFELDRGGESRRV